RRPRVVTAAPELHVEVGAGERDAAGVVPGGVDVLLDEELRGVVAGLRAEHGDRDLAVGDVGAGQDRVAHPETAAQVDRPEGSVDDAEGGPLPDGPGTGEAGEPR